jgi:hypothetical protein
MAWIDQAFSKAYAVFGLMEYQEIRLANSILKKSQKDDGNNDDTNDTPDNVHNPYLLGIIPVPG